MTEHPSRQSWTITVVIALLIWLAAAIAVGATRIVNQAGEPPLILFGFVALPIALGVAVYGVSATFRDWTERLSLTWLVGLHIWRFVGLGFVLAWFVGRVARAGSASPKDSATWRLPPAPWPSCRRFAVARSREGGC